MSSPKNVAFIGTGAPEAGKTLVNHLKTGEHVVIPTSIHPELEEDVTIGSHKVKAFIAPGNTGSRRLFQQTVIEEADGYHGIVYLVDPDSEYLPEAKSEIEKLLSTNSSFPLLVLVIFGDTESSEEQLFSDLGLPSFPNKEVKLAVALCHSQLRAKWLSEKLL